jgi:hypothetical protein
MEQLQSPFAIPHEDVDALNASEGFCMLRNYLARNAEYVALLFDVPSDILHRNIGS